MPADANSHGDFPAPIPEIAAAGNRPLDIATAAVRLSALDHPDIPVEAYLDHLAAIADAAAPLNDPADLGAVLGGAFGYEGDTERYDDLSNMDMIEVIDRRRGLPVALGILYLHAARAAGWEAHGLNFPGHFVIQVRTPFTHFYLDPFSQGRAMERRDLDLLLSRITNREEPTDARHFDPVSDRDVLLRLQNNAVIRLIQSGDLTMAHHRLRRMTAMAPDRLSLWRELAIISDAAGLPGEAREAAAQALERAGDHPELGRMREEMQSLLRRSAQRLN